MYIIIHIGITRNYIFIIIHDCMRVFLRLCSRQGTMLRVTFQLRKVNGGRRRGSPTKQETCTKRPLIMNRDNSSLSVDTAAPLTPVDPRLLNVKYTIEQRARKVTIKNIFFKYDTHEFAKFLFSDISIFSSSHNILPIYRIIL